MTFAINALVPETIPPGIRRLIFHETEGGRFLVCLGKGAGAVAQLNGIVTSSPVPEDESHHVDEERIDNSPLVQSVVAGPCLPSSAPMDDVRATTSRPAQLPLFTRPRRARGSGPKKIGTKLTLPQVRALKRALRDSGKDDAALAADFGIHRTHVSRIRRGVTYKRIRAARPAAVESAISGGAR